MIGPTGVGKTEIARRLAQLARAPFLKVEASKFTEVGYVGRDVDSIVRDLVEVSVKLVRDEEAQKVRGRAKDSAEERVLDLLLPRGRARSPIARASRRPTTERRARRREKLRAMLRDGKLDDREVEVELADESQSVDVGARRPARHRRERAVGPQGHARFVRPQDQAPEAEGAQSRGAR